MELYLYVSLPSWLAAYLSRGINLTSDEAQLSKLKAIIPGN
jgi:hypothetical protein